MDADTWRRIQEIAAKAFDRPPEEREALLAEHCGDDAELREQVERLLTADQEAEGFLSRPVAVVAAGDVEEGDPETPIPVRVGPYRIERRLHTGGMGEVYLATRDDDEFERRVAIKCIRGRLDSERSRRWFRAERQMLARLEHPKIARLYDGGTTDDGQPYLAMEYIEGEPLDLYCARHRSTVRQRLGLVLGVCEAVRHAHQNLLIHRDLKPSNILVTADGEPKLLDFGIAKELPGDEPDLPAPATATGLHPLTPGYAAPEQVLGRPVRTTTDVHALGILLWELLTGRRLFGGADRLPHQAATAICEETPEPPSQALGEPAIELEVEDGERRSLRPPGPETELRRELAGDLDAILAMALAKEPEHRYPSVEALADDLERHLEGLPVKAVRPTRRYRLVKAWRRHRLAATVAALVVTLVVVFTSLLFIQARQVARERDALDDALEFFTSIFEGADPYAIHGGQLTVLQALEGSQAPLLEGGLGAKSRAHLLDALGHIYLNLGRSEKAGPLFEASLALRQDLWPDRVEVADGLYGLGRHRLLASDFEEALTHFEAAAEIHRRRRSSVVRSASAELALADTLLELGEVNHGTERILGTIERLESEAEGDTLELAAAHQSLVTALRYSNLEEEAIAANRRAADIYRRQLGAQHPRTVRTESTLAVLLAQQGELEEAHRILHEVLESQRSTLGSQHPATLTTLHNLASNRLRAGDLEAAQPLLEEAIEGRKLRPGTDLAMSYYNLTTLHLRQGQAEAALESGVEALRLREEFLGEDHAQTALAGVHLAEAYLQAGDAEESEALARWALEILELRGGKSASVLYHPLVLLGRLHLSSDRLDGAEAFIERAHDVVRDRLPPEHWRRAQLDGLLGARHLRAGDLATAEELLTRSREALHLAVGADDPRVHEIEGYWQELTRRLDADL